MKPGAKEAGECHLLLEPDDMHDHLRVCLNINQEYPHGVSHLDGIAEAIDSDLRGSELLMLVSHNRSGTLPKELRIVHAVAHSNRLLYVGSSSSLETIMVVSKLSPVPGTAGT